jgi:3-dehydroquinate dehydratase-1
LINSTLICVSIIKKTLSEMIETANKLAFEPVDLIEFRLDYLKPFPRLEELLNILKVKKNKIATLRPLREGGESSLPEEERVKILEALVERKIEYVDIEYNTVGVEKFLEKAVNCNVKTILSKHLLNGTPSLKKLESLFNEMSGLNPSFIKISTMIKNKKDILNLAKLILHAEKKQKKIIVTGMGEQGKITRILAPIIGSKITYCSIPGEPAAPGQLDYIKMIKILKELT